MTVDALPAPPIPAGAEAYGAWWDEEAAAAATRFFPTYLRHTEGEWAGRPFVLSAWQRDRVIRPIFGWKRADGTRLIRIVWLEVPRKNGKTEMAAGVSLLALLGDAEMGGQVYSMAVDKNQARIVFSKAGVMVGMSEELRRHLEVFKTSIYCSQLNAGFQPLSAGPQGKHGFSPSAAIGDEVHEWTDGGELADIVHKGTAARRQPLEIYITTAGISGMGFAWQQHELALDILAGRVVDPTFLPVIFAAPEEADWRAEPTWRMANPNYGISPKAEYMREEAEKAARSPRAENDFKRFHLNIWTEQVTRWLPMGEKGWKGCSAEPKQPNLWRTLFERMRGRRCFGGLDLSMTSDLSSQCWAFPPDDEWTRWVYLWRFWLPRETIVDAPLARRKRYEAFEEVGALTVTDGNVVDNDAIRMQVCADAEVYQPAWIGVDPFNATDLSVRLRDQDGLPVEFLRQGFISMNAPAKLFERRVTSTAIEHGNNPVATWMARNAVVRRDPAGNIKPDKEKAADKIDGIVAAVIATAGDIVSDGDDVIPADYELKVWGA